MTKFLVAALVGAFGLGGYLSAQDQPAQNDTRDARIAALERALVARMSAEVARRRTTTCASPEARTREVGGTVIIGRRRYQCVQVLDENLQPIAVGWTLVSPQP
jgi:hypothetical protein